MSLVAFVCLSVCACLASWATSRTLPSAIGKSSKRDVDLASEGLMCWGVVPKSGYMTQEAQSINQLINQSINHYFITQLTNRNR